jgi:hypothetical protein
MRRVELNEVAAQVILAAGAERSRLRRCSMESALVSLILSYSSPPAWHPEQNSQRG